MPAFTILESHNGRFTVTGADGTTFGEADNLDEAEEILAFAREFACACHADADAIADARAAA